MIQMSRGAKCVTCEYALTSVSVNATAFPKTSTHVTYCTNGVNTNLIIASYMNNKKVETKKV
jgi:hypothetical protein